MLYKDKEIEITSYKAIEAEVSRIIIENDLLCFSKEPAFFYALKAILALGIVTHTRPDELPDYLLNQLQGVCLFISLYELPKEAYIGAAMSFGAAYNDGVMEDIRTILPSFKEANEKGANSNE